MAGKRDTSGESAHELRSALARAFGGAVFFSLPLLMTMEMWWLGFYIDRLRLALFLALMLPILIGLSHFSGIRHNTSWTGDVADALVAYAVAFFASFLVLVLFNVVSIGSMPLREVVGKTSLQAVPASFGAILANSQLGQSDEQAGSEEARRSGAHYPAQLFFMLAGALFLAFNVAPTEEMVLIAFQMTHWHAVALMLATIAMMHGFVYSARFRGSPEVAPGTSRRHLLLRFSIVGYAIALLASAAVLWTFGRFDGHGTGIYVAMTVVLAFPAGLGAAAARLIL